eukprot:1694585-Prymnesium_polylepis.1
MVAAILEREAAEKAATEKTAAETAKRVASENAVADQKAVADKAAADKAVSPLLVSPLLASPLFVASRAASDKEFKPENFEPSPSKAKAAEQAEERRSIRRRSDAPNLYSSDDAPIATDEASLLLQVLPQELKAMLQPIDVHKSGIIEWEEFLAFALPSGLDYDRVRQLWQQLISGPTRATSAEVEVMSSPPQ